MGGALGSTATRDEQVFDKDSMLGRLEQAGREMEKAEKAGKPADPAQALNAVMGAMTGSGAAEALPADTLKSFVPDTLGGLARQSISVEHNAMMGVQIGNAKARYGDDEHQLRLEITDTGGAAGLMAMAGWANIERSSEDGPRSERTGREGSRMVHEVWNSDSNSGEYSLVLGNRFVVKLQGKADSLDVLKSAAGEVDLARLESLRNEGMKSTQ